MKRMLILIVFFIMPGVCLAEAGDTAIVEFWNCELKEGKEMEAVEANNKKWLAFVRNATGSEEINSYALQSLVGDSTSFWFADVFPDLKTWAAAKDAFESGGGAEIEAEFEELQECAKNRLYRSTEH